MSLPDVEVLTPTFLTDLVALPFQADILLDPQTQTRWKKDGETFVRDYEGEASWEEMAAYVGQTYSDVSMSSYRHALEVKNVR